jgi:hypothetical protein
MSKMMQELKPNSKHKNRESTQNLLLREQKLTGTTTEQNAPEVLSPANISSLVFTTQNFGKCLSFSHQNKILVQCN